MLVQVEEVFKKSYPVSSRKAYVIRENTLFCVYVPVIASF